MKRYLIYMKLCHHAYMSRKTGDLSFFEIIRDNMPVVAVIIGFGRISWNVEQWAEQIKDHYENERKKHATDNVSNN